jgi:nitrite reductase/ring-hydroxylating ferredoxin subunit
VTARNWVDAGPAVPRGEIRTVRIGETDVAVAHTQGTWRAFDDECTHHGCPLSDGVLEGATIECECHGSIFELGSGVVVRGPATEPIRVHAAEVRDGRVYVLLR